MPLQPPELEADRLTPPRPAAREPLSARRRQLLWVGGALLLVLLLVLTPPLVNANRYRATVAKSMSASLGRPVHLDNVSLHLLPVPGLTLQNLVVSEDPAFGAEPTIRADTVEATLRVSSLWHRPIEFSTVQFVNPSVNLVRDAAGRWNLSDVLLHASRVDSAPTVQRHAGPTPRFPYIEATGGRVNVKLGQEKLPFSLTDADFALWLPSPQQWRVRLKGHPARTDANITDPGTLRVEGELRRAETAMAVPASFTASWHDAPLGEASRILTGEDWGWRGSLNLDAALEGTLGDARLTSKLTLGGLRRAEFFPTRPLDLQITCRSGFALHPAGLLQGTCQLPDDGPEPLTLRAAQLRLQDPAATEATVDGSGIPLRWAMLWAALFSPRVPTDLHPAGTVEIHLLRTPLPAPAGPDGQHKTHARKAVAELPTLPRKTVPMFAGTHWTGGFRVSLPGGGLAGQNDGLDTVPPAVLNWSIVPGVALNAAPSLRMASTALTLDRGAGVSVSANISEAGYSVAVNGTATAANLLLPARYLPQLGDGLEEVLPYPPASAAPTHVQFTCVRNGWTTPQVCSGFSPGAAARTGAPGGSSVPAVAITPAGNPSQTRLAPQSLSPLERAPLSAPR